MKKIISAVVCLLMVGVLSGCSEKAEIVACKVEQEGLKVDVALTTVNGNLTEMKTTTTITIPDQPSGEVLRVAAEQTKVDTEKYAGVSYEYAINNESAIITMTYNIKKMVKDEYMELGFTDSTLTDGKIDPAKLIEMYNLSGIQCESTK